MNSWIHYPHYTYQKLPTRRASIDRGCNWPEPWWSQAARLPYWGSCWLICLLRARRQGLHRWDPCFPYSLDSVCERDVYSLRVIGGGDIACNAEPQCRSPWPSLKRIFHGGLLVASIGPRPSRRVIEQGVRRPWKGSVAPGGLADSRVDSGYCADPWIRLVTTRSSIPIRSVG